MKHPLPEATRRICGDDSGLKDPERWVMRQLRSGRFRGQKVGRRWFMSDQDIAAAEEALYPAPKVEPAEPDELVSVVAGLSTRSRRRLKASA